MIKYVTPTNFSHPDDLLDFFHRKGRLFNKNPKVFNFPYTKTQIFFQKIPNFLQYKLQIFKYLSKTAKNFRALSAPLGSPMPFARFRVAALSLGSLVPLVGQILAPPLAFSIRCMCLRHMPVKLGHG